MSKRKILAIGAALVLAAGVGTYAFTASSEEDDHGFRSQSMRGMGHGMMGGIAGMGRDAAVSSDLAAIHELAVNHDLIKRTVSNLADGIRTATESDDPRTARLIREHVARMGERVRSGRMMGVPIESPAVHAIYANKDKIRTTTETTAKGVIVVQTSSDPEIVALLQRHAVEVSDLVKGGMEAMHAAMMRNHLGMMGGMRGPMMGMHGMRRGMMRDDD